MTGLWEAEDLLMCPFECGFVACDEAAAHAHVKTHHRDEIAQLERAAETALRSFSEAILSE